MTTPLNGRLRGHGFHLRQNDEGVSGANRAFNFGNANDVFEEFMNMNGRAADIGVEHASSSFPNTAGVRHTDHKRSGGDVSVPQTISKDSTAGQQANFACLLAELGKKNAARLFPDVEPQMGQSPKIFRRNDSRLFQIDAPSPRSSRDLHISVPLETSSGSPSPRSVSSSSPGESFPPIIGNTSSLKTEFAQEYIRTAREHARPVHNAQSPDGESLPPIIGNTSGTKAEFAQEYIRTAREHARPVHNVQSPDGESLPPIIGNTSGTKAEFAQEYIRTAREHARPVHNAQSPESAQSIRQAHMFVKNTIDQLQAAQQNQLPMRLFTTDTPSQEWPPTFSPRPPWFDHNTRPRSSNSKSHDIGIFEPSKDATISRSTFSPTLRGLRTRPRSPLPSSVDQSGDFTRLQSDMADLPPDPARFNLDSFPESMHSSLGNLSKGNKIQSFSQGGSPDRIQTGGAYLYPSQKTLEEMAGIVPRASSKTSSQIGP
ncbi:unnamed protein product [Clonostachys chloroleuca]|uniref:Uncharacterized protein n=1 Tax=Clonostachys chloroleuca TaxID=1926264 RepID=A0AA35LRZ3_9HYPO|nr:unnamed protein product [Clonostachys chloroleuca]